MIYLLDSHNRLEQGDVCEGIPKISPENLIGWEDYVLEYFNTTSPIKRPVKFSGRPIPVNGVILSQTCDLRLNTNVLFAELLPKDNLSPNNYRKSKEIIKIIRNETRFHYFPVDDRISLFESQKVLDFKSLFIIPYNILGSNINSFFKARLIPEAREVLRDKISKLFTRLAFEDSMYLSDKQVKSMVSNNDMNLEEVNDFFKSINRDPVEL